jgi:uncharacterized protein YdcH (DUF465 family)
MKDEEIIQQLITQNSEARKLWEEHQNYEKLLSEFNNKPVLTAEEEMEKKRIQKLKLAGKDRLYKIIQEYKKKLNS